MFDDLLPIRLRAVAGLKCCISGSRTIGGEEQSLRLSLSHFESPVLAKQPFLVGGECNEVFVAVENDPSPVTFTTPTQIHGQSLNDATHLNPVLLVNLP